MLKSTPMKCCAATISFCCLLPVTATLAHPGAHDKLAYISQRLKAQPEDQQLYIQRGSTYSNDGQFDNALADLRTAETLGDSLAVAFELGVLYYRTGEIDTARAYFDSWLKQSPKHTPALEYRARLLRDAGDYQASLADYKALFALRKHNNPGNYIAAAKMLAEVDDEGLTAAIEILDQGMRQLGLAPQLQRYAIKLELQRQQIAYAIARLGSLEPMLGTSPNWKTDMGELLLMARRKAEARKLFDAATSQLATLRKTPARRRLLEKIAKINHTEH